MKLGTNKEMSKIKWGVVNGYITDSWYKGTVDFVHKSNKRYLPKNKCRGEKMNKTNLLEICEGIVPIHKKKVIWLLWKRLLNQKYELMTFISSISFECI